MAGEKYNHSFSVEEAVKYGSIEKALLMKELQGMSEYKKRHGQDGYVYYSSAALFEKFPYMKKRSISRWLDELEADGHLIIDRSGERNANKYDRTRWYFPADQNGDSICQNGQEICQNGQEICQNGPTIPPQSTPQSTPLSSESKKRFAPPTKQEVAEFFATNGSTIEEAGSYYYHFDERDWTLSNGRKMKSWQKAAQKWIHNSKTKYRNHGSYRKNGALGAQQPLDAAGAKELDEMLRTDPRIQH